MAIGLADLSLLWQVVTSSATGAPRQGGGLHRGVPVDERELKLTVVARNIGRSDESVDWVGLNFREEPPGLLGNSSTIADAGQDLGGEAQGHLDLGPWGCALPGRAALPGGGGARLRQEAGDGMGDLDTESLVIAGLTDAVLPPPTDNEIDAATRRLFPRSRRRAEVGAGEEGEGMETEQSRSPGTRAAPAGPGTRSARRAPQRRGAGRRTEHLELDGDDGLRFQFVGQSEVETRECHPVIGETLGLVGAAQVDAPG